MICFKYRIYPNRKTKKTIDRTLWLCRTLYNAALDERNDSYKLEGKSLNYYDQANSLVFLKENNPCFKQVHSQVLQDVLKRLDKAYQAFFAESKQVKQQVFQDFKAKNDTTVSPIRKVDILQLAINSNFPKSAK